MDSVRGFLMLTFVRIRGQEADMGKWRSPLFYLLFFFLAFAACTSPELTRTRGSGPGADVGNRGKTVQMHEGSKPFEKTPKIIPTEGPPLTSASQADQLSRQ